MNATNKPNIR